jgi:hypothetical protein
MTKTKFMAALRAELINRYEWTKTPGKLGSFMESVKETIAGGMGNIWNKDGEASEAAWKAIGGKGKPTYKALRALPE